MPAITGQSGLIEGMRVAAPRPSLQDLLQASAALHNHLCPRQVLGVRMGMYAGELLRLELPQTDKRLLVIVETDGCFADGVATATNCWIGRRTMRVVDYGKTAATFIDTETEVALRLAPRRDARQLAPEYAPAAANRWEAMLLGYQQIELPLLFDVQQVTLKTPLAQILSRPGVRRTCDRCGEEIINERELLVGGECLCQACAGGAYYDTGEPGGGAVTGAAHDPSLAFGALRADALERRVAQRTQELMALFDISQEIVAQLDLDTLLGTISDQARALLQAQAAMLCLLNAEGDALQLAKSSGRAGAQPGMSQPTSRELASQVIGAGQNVVTPAACTDCAVLRKFGPNSCIAVPLCAGESTIGALCVVRASEHAFDTDQARSLRLLANTAAIAITNARLADAARQEATRAAACAEREHLAAELHDSLAQTLAFLNLKTGVLESQLRDSAGAAGDPAARVASELATMAAAISTAYAQVRAALTGLQRPPAPPNDLAGALDQIVAEFRATAGMDIELVIADPRALAIPGDAQSQVKHILREALTNTRRHAQARHVQVSVTWRGGRAHFAVTDDGCGFDPQRVDTRQHMGLAIMRRRAASAGGQLQVESAPGTGTRIVISFPLEQRGQHEQ